MFYPVGVSWWVNVVGRLVRVEEGVATYNLPARFPSLSMTCSGKWED